jgi:hypothetical protein
VTQVVASVKALTDEQLRSPSPWRGELKALPAPLAVEAAPEAG